MVTYLGVPTGVGKAACGEAPLSLVDAAFERSGSTEAHDLERRYCSRCDIAALCLDAAMEHPEFGVWGGTGQRQRTKAGAGSPRLHRSTRLAAKRAG